MHIIKKQDLFKHTYIHTTGYVFAVCVYMVLRLATLNLTTNKSSSLGDANSPSLSSHELPVVLYLGMGLYEIVSFHVNLSADIAIALVLFMHIHTYIIHTYICTYIYICIK